MTTQVIDGTISLPGPVTFLGAVTGAGNVVAKYPYVIAAVGGNTVLTANNTGNIILLGAATAAAGIAIPTAVGSSGLNYTFIVTANANGFAYTITPAGGSVQGVIISTAGTAHKAAAATIVSATGAANLLAGDRLTLISDGTNWSAIAIGAGAAAGWA